MIDAHIHIEKGPYMTEWVSKFVKQADQRDIHEIWLLEHCYRFKEFTHIYEDVCTYSEYIFNWFNRKSGVLMLDM